jgi:Big-like domain-containing protein
MNPGPRRSRSKLLSRAARVAAALVALSAGCGRQPVDFTGVNDFSPGTDGALSDGRVIDGGDAGDAGDGGDAGRTLIALTISGDPAPLSVGDVRMFRAIATWSDATTSDVTATAAWSTNSPQVISVQTGIVKAVSPGDAFLIAQSNGATARLPLRVTGTTMIASISIFPAFAMMLSGQSMQLSAVATFGDGSTMDVTSMVTWKSDLENVASVMGGLVKAQSPGVARITASLGGISGDAQIVVTSAQVIGLTIIPSTASTALHTRLSFSAQGQLSDGTQVDLTTSVQWTSLDPMIATIDASGVASGLSAGTATITAQFGAFMARAILTITPADLIGLQIAPMDPTVGVNTRIPFHATAFFSDGTSADVTASAIWASSDPSIVAIDPSGTAIASTPGTSVITAAFGGFSAHSVVSVTSAMLTGLSVAPNPLVLSQFEMGQLRATARFSDGTMSDVTGSVTWSSGQPMIASVSSPPSPAGIVTGLSPGTATVTASFGGFMASATVVVSAAELVALRIEPPMVNAPPGITVLLHAIGTFSDGSMRDVTALVSWTSSDPSVADVSNFTGSEGTLFCQMNGTATITAMFMGITGTASVTVTGVGIRAIEIMPVDLQTTVGTRTPYTATVVFTDGTTADITTQATWTTDDASIASISNAPGAQGQLTAQGPGTTFVRASFMGFSGSTPLTVVGAQLVQLTISPIMPMVQAGQTVQFSARAIFSDGTSRNVTAISQWSSSNANVAAINGFGTATAMSPGSSMITVRFMGFTASTTIVVGNALLVQVQVTPIQPSVPIGSSIQFQAVAIFSDGTSRNITGMAMWSSSNPMVFRLAGGPIRGRGTGVAAGTSEIAATFMGVTGSTTVTVTPAVVVGISVSPALLTVAVGTRQQYQADAIFSDGTSMNVTGMSTWTTGDQSVAQISNGRAMRGNLTAIGPGTTNVTAQFMGVRGSAQVTVTNARITEIQVTPFDRTVALGFPIQYQAVAIYSDGTSRQVTNMSTWQSSNPMVAAVSNAFGSQGLATPLGPGMTMISATFMGVTGSTTLTVTSATITQIQVTPFNPSVPQGFTQRMTATAIFSDGTTRDVTQLATWTSSDPSIAAVTSVGQRGTVSALAPGAATITAQYLGARGSTMVTVTSAVLDAITVTPNSAAIAPGDVVQFTATGMFSDGAQRDLTTVVTWTSSDTMIADVSNATGSQGEATGFAPGTSTITAQYGRVTGTAQLTVR